MCVPYTFLKIYIDILGCQNAWNRGQIGFDGGKKWIFYIQNWVNIDFGKRLLPDFPSVKSLSIKLKVLSHEHLKYQ